MTGFIVAAIVWGVVGFVATGILWALTVWSSALLGVTAMEPGAKVMPWVPVATFFTGIILTVSWFILVVYMVVSNIISAVNAGG